MTKTTTQRQTDLVQLRSTSESSRSTTDNCYLFASVVLWEVCSHQIMAPRVVYDGILNVLNGHSRCIDIQHTGTLQTHTQCDKPIAMSTAVIYGSK